MKKSIYKLSLFLILICLFSFRVNATELMGTCYCLKMDFMSTTTVACESYNGTSDSDFDSNGNYTKGSICEDLCSQNDALWYGSETVSSGTATIDLINRNTNFPPYNDTTKADCKKKTINNNVSCENNYDKNSCPENGTWDGNCCTLREVCWFLTIGTASNTDGKLYWSKTNPCLNNTEYPNATCSIRSGILKKDCVEDKVVSDDEVAATESNDKDKSEVDFSMLEVGFGPSGQTCEEVLGDNLAKILKFVIIALRIAAAIIVLVVGMLTLIPPIVKGEASELKKSTHKLVLLAIVLALVALLPTLLNIIGKIFEWDLTCII